MALFPCDQHGGRYRQHHQTGIEAIGSADPAIDAEVIALGVAYLDALQITGYTLHLNSVGCPQCRPRLRSGCGPYRAAARGREARRWSACARG